MYKTESPLIDKITLVKDETTPSGVRLAVPAGGQLPMRYQQPGLDHREHFAWCLLDLVAQNTAGAAGLNGKSLVQQAHIVLLENILNYHIYERRVEPKKVIETSLNIILALP